MVDLCLLEAKHYPMSEFVRRPFVSCTPTAMKEICASLLMERKSWATGQVHTLLRVTVGGSVDDKYYHRLETTKPPMAISTAIGDQINRGWIGGLRG